MIKSSKTLRQGGALPVDEAQAARRLHTPDARDSHRSLAGSRQHLGLGTRRRTEQQLVVVAAGQAEFVLQRARQRGLARG